MADRNPQLDRRDVLAWAVGLSAVGLAGTAVGESNGKRKHVLRERKGEANEDSRPGEYAPVFQIENGQVQPAQNGRKQRGTSGRMATVSAASTSSANGPRTRGASASAERASKHFNEALEEGRLELAGRDERGFVLVEINDSEGDR